MLLSYPILINRTEDGAITSFCCPDLNYEYNDATLNRLNYGNFLSFARQKLEEHIAELIRNRIRIKRPKTQSDYEHITLGPKDLWTNLSVNVEIKRSCCEWFLPKFGIFSNIVSIVLSGIIALAAMELTAGGATGQALGICGVIFGSIMAFIVYRYSNTVEGLAQQGAQLDECFRSQFQPSEETTNPSRVHALTNRNRCNSTCFIFSTLGLGTALVGNVAVSAVTSFQEVHSLSGRLENQRLGGTDTLISPELMDYTAYLNTIFTSISNLTFLSTFFARALEALENCCTRKPPSSESRHLIHSSSPLGSDPRRLSANRALLSEQAQQSDSDQEPERKNVQGVEAYRSNVK